MDPVNRFNHTSRAAIVTPTDRPKSVRNCCVIEVFGGVYVLSSCFFGFSVGVGAIVIGLSQISFFFSSTKMFAPFISDLIINMDHMHILGTELSSMIRSRTK